MGWLVCFWCSTWYIAYCAPRASSSMPLLLPRFFFIRPRASSIMPQSSGKCSHHNFHYTESKQQQAVFLQCFAQLLVPINPPDSQQISFTLLGKWDNIYQLRIQFHLEKFIVQSDLQGLLQMSYMKGRERCSNYSSYNKCLVLEVLGQHASLCISHYSLILSRLAMQSLCSNVVGKYLYYKQSPLTF